MIARHIKKTTDVVVVISKQQLFVSLQQTFTLDFSLSSTASLSDSIAFMQWYLCYAYAYIVGGNVQHSLPANG